MTSLIRILLICILGLTAAVADYEPVSGDLLFDPQQTYKNALEQEKQTGRTMIWDGITMAPAPEGFQNPLTPDAMAAGWRPVVVNGEVVGACDGSQCTSSALQPDLFISQQDGTPSGTPK
ncbi:MAG: hypothetical protein M1527_04285 [Gammaproteobacteria bacterium]|nr:hypothetical protein [Gammaproteobacteria bacterium]